MNTRARDDDRKECHMGWVRRNVRHVNLLELVHEIRAQYPRHSARERKPTMPLTIHPDLHSLIPPLTPEESAQLEANLLAEGCREPLLIWQEEQTLLDGHNRLDICTRHGLPYTTHEVSLPDLDAAKAWMIANQLGRRNLTADQASHLRGQQYKLQKKISRGGGDHRSPDAIDQKVQSEPFDDTATRLAKEHKVSKSTIKRDAAYASAIDTLADALGPDVRQAILTRDTKITREGVTQLAELARLDIAAAQEALTDIQAAPTTTEAREALTWHVGADHGRTTNAAPAPLVLEPEAPETDETTAPTTWPQSGASGDYEWYTPPAWLDPVRQVLGTIDLDPASCADAQARVRATTYYTKDDDGLRHPWHGHVFLNPPYKLPEIEHFLGKLVEELEAGHTTEAILLVNNATETGWFQFISGHADIVFFPKGKIRFLHATRDETAGPCVGQALLYFGKGVTRFCEVFGPLGLLMQPLASAQAAQLSLAEAPAPTPQEAPSTIADRILAALRGAPAGLTNAQIAAALGTKQTDTRWALGRFVQDGRVRHEGTQYVLLVQQEGT
jgi:hypothetical protein